MVDTNRQFKGLRWVAPCAISLHLQGLSNYRLQAYTSNELKYNNVIKYFTNICVRHQNGGTFVISVMLKDNVCQNDKIITSTK